MSSDSLMPKIMIFRPTWNEFKNFNDYIAYMESQGAHKAGIAKVIPPPEWVPRKKGYVDNEIMNIVIPTPICQYRQGIEGIYQQNNVPQESMTVAEYKIMSEFEEYQTPYHLSYSDLEVMYWNNINVNAPYYGADVSGSITDEDVHVWNISKLGSILDYIFEDYNAIIEGVNTPYLYFGMWNTAFPWHTEDMDLYSINYVHDGYPKTWYAIPPENGQRFERLAAKLFPIDAKACPAFLRHKQVIISPSVLTKNDIPFNKITQESHEFIITFPYGYHAGFNHGFNIAESTNFASPRWVNYGKHALLCRCREDTININMDTFIKRIQPEKYKLWLQGNDFGTHPEDQSRIFAAPLPYKDDISKEKKNLNTPEKNKKTRNGRQFHPVTHNGNIEFQLLHDESDSSESVHSTQDVRNVIEKLEDTESDEELNDEERQIMEDIWLKAFNNTEVSNNDENESTSDSDYSYNKKKSKKKRRTKSKKNKKTQKTKLSRKKNPKKNDDKVESNNYKRKIQPSTNSKRLTCVNSNQISEEFVCNKSLKTNKISESIDCINNLNNDNSFYTSIESVNNNSDSILWKLLSGLPKNINDMISNNCTFEIEQQYNKFRSMKDPYCSLCIIFNRNKLNFSLNWQMQVPSDLPSFPKKSKAYFKYVLHGSKTPIKSNLIRCENCFLIVHQVCYGVTLNKNTPWMCDRCKTKSFNATCAYCPLKGGVIKMLEKNIWSHPECNLFVHGNSLFSSHIFSTDISTTKRCVVCKLTNGNCFCCCGGGCELWFHISCGIIAGIQYQVDKQNPQNILIHCNKHYYEPNKQTFYLDQSVWAKHPLHNAISLCHISKIEQVPVCLIEYSDGSIANDIKLEDIKNYECYQNSKLPIDEVELVNGDKVSFLGIQYKSFYSVVFNDGTHGNIYNENILGENHLNMLFKGKTV